MNTKPNSTATPARQDQLDFTPAYLSTLTGRELFSILEAVTQISDLIDGLLCQPRMESAEDRTGYNSAGQLLAVISAEVDQRISAIAGAAVDLAGSDPIDQEWKAWTLLSYELRQKDNLSAFAVKAAIAATFTDRTAATEVGDMLAGWNILKPIGGAR